MVYDSRSEEWNASRMYEDEFRRQLARTGDVQLKARETLISGLEDIGIKGVKKLLPAISVYADESNFADMHRELWVSPTTNIEHPHDSQFDSLHDFINASASPLEPPIAKLSCYVLRDTEDNLYLIIGREDVYEFAEEDIGEFEDMAQRYGIKKIVGNFGLRGSLPKVLLSVENNLVDDMREELYLLEYAKKWRMTNSQYLRFHSLVKAGHANKESHPYGEFLNYGELAKSIVLDDEGHL